MNNIDKIYKLKETQEKAETLFEAIQDNNLIRPNISEKELSEEIYLLAKEKLLINKYWHKRIVRSGKNTILPYDFSPENRKIEKDDIIWIDFGPIFENYEADFGRTYVLGDDKGKLDIKLAVEETWIQGRDFFFKNNEITGKELFDFVNSKAKEKGYIFGNYIAGHLIDEFPHTKIHQKNPSNYISLENNLDMKSSFNGKERFWILEIHFINQEKTYGSFFEQLLI